MHSFKNKSFAVFLLSFVFLFAACAATSETPDGSAKTYSQVQENKQALLEQSFASFRDYVNRDMPPESLFVFITDTSRYWMDTLELAAQTESLNLLEERPFHEVLAIITYRLYEKEKMWTVPENRMLFIMISKHGILWRLTDQAFGPAEVRNDRGTFGLSITPKIPLMIFTWDDQSWRLDLRETMPLVMRGYETIAIKKSLTRTQLALDILEKEFRYDVMTIDDSLLHPVPSI